MITGKIKTKPMLITSHRMGMLRLAKRVEQIPEEKRTEEDKRLLADVATEERGILTGADVVEMKREAATQTPAPVVEENLATTKPKVVKGGKKKKT